jgi:hypothetical protein
MPKRNALAPSDRDAIQTLLSALKPLSKVRGSIPVLYAVA